MLHLQPWYWLPNKMIGSDYAGFDNVTVVSAVEGIAARVCDNVSIRQATGCARGTGAARPIVPVSRTAPCRDRSRIVQVVHTQSRKPTVRSTAFHRMVSAVTHEADVVDGTVPCRSRRAPVHHASFGLLLVLSISGSVLRRGTGGAMLRR